VGKIKKMGGLWSPPKAIEWRSGLFGFFGSYEEVRCVRPAGRFQVCAHALPMWNQ
jgi:hypothetical protein